MGVYLQLGKDKVPADLASTMGWGDVGRYANSLPAKTADCLVHLFHHGYEVDIADLQQEVRAAMKTHAPKSDVESTLDNLLSLLKGAGDVPYVIVTNGIIADEETSTKSTEVQIRERIAEAWRQ